MKSWKTTLTGILTILAALSAAAIDYLQHGTLPNFGVLLPMLATGIGLINAKDGNVTNSPKPVESYKTPAELPSAPVNVTTASKLPLIAGLMIPVVFLATSCSTTSTGNPLIDRRNRVANALLTVAAKTIGGFAVNTLKSVIQDEMKGNKIDFASSAAEGAWASAASVVNSSDVEKIINAWGGDKLPLVAIEAQKQYNLAVASGVAPEDALSAIANVIGGTAAASK